MAKRTQVRPDHLRLVEHSKLPKTLGEYAGTADIDAGLTTKLGSDGMWLFANELYGIERAGDVAAHHLDATRGIPVPVRYRNLRSLVAVREINELGEEAQSLLPPQEPVAVFTIDRCMKVDGQDTLETGVAITDHAEVAVRLGQAVTLLDYSEYTLSSVKYPSFCSRLRLVHSDEWQ